MFDVVALLYTKLRNVLATSASNLVLYDQANGREASFRSVIIKNRSDLPGYGGPLKQTENSHTL